MCRGRGDEMKAASGSGSLSAVGAAAVSAEAGASARRLLVERAQAGDVAAFEVLLDRWLEPAFRIALVILGDEPDARDATQDAFLAAWRALPGLRDPERFDAWLTQILVNSCRAIGRRKRRATVREIRVEGLGDLEEPAGTVDAVDERAASLDLIQRAWFRLSVAERTILAMHHLEHRPLDEIAAALAIPQGTAKSRLFNARRSLERAVEAEQR